MTARGKEKSMENPTTMERTSDREIVITRTFDAPPRIVFDVWTRPEFVRRWYSPRSCTEVVDIQADVRVGGTYRYVTRADGQEFAFIGRYREVTPPSRLVYTEMFEPPGQTANEADGAIVTVTFEERDGKTHLVSHSLFPSKEVLDMVLSTGMEHGMRETMDQLDDLIRSFGAPAKLAPTLD